MKRLLSLAIATMLLCGCLGCAGCANPVTPKKLTASVKPSGAASLETAPGLADDFSQKLFAQALARDDKNTVISPLSAYLCLAMAMNGADGATLAEFERAMGGNIDAVNAFCKNLQASLMDVRGDTKLSIANSAWLDDDGVTVREDYIQSIVDNLGADIFTADLPSKETVEAVNAWVKENTHGLIPTLRDTPYDEDIVMTLINTLYFKAKWECPFDGYSTTDKEFTKADGSKISALFMQDYMSEREYINTGDAEGILMRYDDGKNVFVALRPRGGESVREFAANLKPGGLSGYIAAAENKLMNFSMPKYSVEYDISMNGALESMGLKQLFTPNADLSGMGESATGKLYISDVHQKVKLIVDEEGTEAAAVTEALAGCAMAPEDPIELHFDSPFMYAVVDVESGLPLFIGVLDEPQSVS